MSSRTLRSRYVWGSAGSLRGEDGRLMRAAMFSSPLQSTSAGSALKTIRETELYGGVLSSALSREHLYLTAEFLRGDECVVAGPL